MSDRKTEEQNLTQKILGLGEERMTEVLDELLSNERVSSIMGRAMMRTQTLKASLDKNVALALSMVNQPTREDFDRLRKQVRRLERQVDDLTEEVESLRKPKPARKRTPKAKT